MKKLILTAVLLGTLGGFSIAADIQPQATEPKQPEKFYQLVMSDTQIMALVTIVNSVPIKGSEAEFIVQLKRTLLNPQKEVTANAQ